MKNTLFIALLLISFLGYSQNESFKLRGSQIREIEKRAEFVQKYADSLNSFSTTDAIDLPNFFYDFDFDRNNKVGWISLHSGISLRKLILDKTNNVQLLEAVLKKKDRRLKKRKKIPKKQYIGDIIIPFQNYCTYELVRLRLTELMNERNMGKRASNYPN